MSPLEPGPSAMHLVHTMSGDLVQLDALIDPPLSGAGIPLGLREGEVVQCLRNDAHGVLVARGDGTRILIPPPGAQRVRVRWFPGVHDDDESGTEHRPGVRQTE